MPLSYTEDRVATRLSGPRSGRRSGSGLGGLGGATSVGHVRAAATGVGCYKLEVGLRTPSERGHHRGS